ncbi:alpha/beta hydrolase [Paraburkholderia guartelaensis]|uniref:alpha/beta hydrolase n=1 Tax=Paraburkholderia guartelaensis TaxID=2546446 RepID=UPI002AB75227|nr:alpha/beta hydrolase [Paraburkholderia guartelaensis]
MTTQLQISDTIIAGHAQAIALRSFLPVTSEPLPIVLYFHGGGFVEGGLPDAAVPAAFLASKVCTWVVAVGYSLAPKYPFPAAAEDAYLALQWAVEQAHHHNADSKRLASVGHDAGGNIAAALGAVARDRGKYRVSAQALLAPLLDPSLSRIPDASHQDKRQPELDECARAYRAYLPMAGQCMHPYAAPLESRRLGKLPPTMIATAEHDLVRVDGEAFARELISAGVPVEITRYAGATHAGLISHGPSLEDVAAFLRKQLASGRKL